MRIEDLYYYQKFYSGSKEVKKGKDHSRNLDIPTAIELQEMSIAKSDEKP